MKNTIINALWRILGIAALSVIAPSAFALGVVVIGTDADAPDGMRFQTWNWSTTTTDSQADLDARALMNCRERPELSGNECVIGLRFENAAVAFVRGSSYRTTLISGTPTEVRAKNDKVYYRATSHVPSAIQALLAECRREHTLCRATYAPAIDGISPESAFAVPSSKSSGDSTGKRLAFVAGGAAVAGLAVYAFGGGTAWQDTSFVPVAEYSLNGGIRRYQVGSRMEWQKDNWTAHWQTTKSQNIANSDGLAFGSGVGWTGDIVAAEFISRSVADKSEMTFSLSGEKESGLWKLSPLYRLDYRKGESENTLLHSLTAKLVWAGDQWTVTQSAGFSGDSFSAMTDNAQAKILLRREF